MSTLLVDRISPYQSSSVTIDGFSAPNLATTGSNTFTGNQNIQGTITASIQEGFALVGGVGNVSTLVATSSFGGALPSGVVSGSSQLTASYDTRYALSGSGGGGSGFPFVGDAQITGSLTISSSAAIDLEVIGGIRVSSGSANTTITPLGVNSGGSGAVTNRIGIYSNPSLASLGALTTVTQPSIVVNSSTPPFTTQAIEFNNGTRIGIKLPTEITGSLTISSSAAVELTVIGDSQLTGSLGISGTITASLQQGFVLVGDANGRTTTVATSSFGGGGAAFPFTGAAQITGSLGVSGATTIGGELSVTPALLPNGFPAGIGQFIIPFLSGSTNVIARDSDNALYWQPAFNVLAVSSSTGNTTISNSGLTTTSSTTGSTQITTTRVVSNFGAGRNIAIAGDAESTALTGLTGITNPSIILQSGSAGLPPTFYAPIQFQASQSFTDGRVTITRPLVGLQGAQITGSLGVLGDTTMNGGLNVLGAITASIPEGFFLVGGLGNTTISRSTGSFATVFGNDFIGNQTITGSVDVSGSVKQRFNTPTLGSQTDLVVVNGATINGIPFNQQTIGVQNYDFGVDLYKSAFVIEAWDSTNYAFGGEIHLNGEAAQLLVIASGSGDAGTRNGTIAVVDNGNQKTKAVLTGQIIEIGGAGTNFTPTIAESITIGRSGLTTIVSGSLTTSGSVNVVGSGNQLKLPTGSNQQVGTATLDGGNPGTVTVSNSLVSANSIILLTKQTFNHAGVANVSSKGSGTFTITSTTNGDTDVVGYMIINNS